LKALKILKIGTMSVAILYVTFVSQILKTNIGLI